MFDPRENEYYLINGMLFNKELQKQAFDWLDSSAFIDNFTKTSFIFLKKYKKHNGTYADYKTFNNQFYKSKYFKKSGLSMIDCEDYKKFYAGDEKQALVYLKKVLSNYQSKKMGDYLAIMKDIKLTPLINKDSAEKMREIAKKILENRHKNQSVVLVKSQHEKNKKKLGKKLSGEEINNTIETGWEHLDNLLMGIARQDLTFIVARSGIGKTRWITHLMKNICRISRNKDNGVYMFSIEEPAEKITNLLLSNLTDINSSKFKNYNLTEHEVIKYNSIDLSGYPIAIDDERDSCDLDYIERKIEIMTEGYNCRNFFIDTSNEIKRTAKSEKEHMDMVASRLKSLCKKYDCRIFALAQMNRQSEGRERNEKRPQVYDIKGSDSCYQNADNVIGLYFDDFYKVLYNETDIEKDRIFEAIILKTRDGNKGVSKFIANHGSCSFREIKSYG